MTTAVQFTLPKRFQVYTKLGELGTLEIIANDVALETGQMSTSRLLGFKSGQLTVNHFGDRVANAWHSSPPDLYTDSARSNSIVSESHLKI